MIQRFVVGFLCLTGVLAVGCSAAPDDGEVDAEEVRSTSQALDCSWVKHTYTGSDSLGCRTNSTYNKKAHSNASNVQKYFENYINDGNENKLSWAKPVCATRSTACGIGASVSNSCQLARSTLQAIANRGRAGTARSITANEGATTTVCGLSGVSVVDYETTNGVDLITFDEATQLSNNLDTCFDNTGGTNPATNGGGTAAFFLVWDGARAAGTPNACASGGGFAKIGIDPGQFTSPSLSSFISSTAPAVYTADSTPVAGGAIRWSPNTAVSAISCTAESFVGRACLIGNLTTGTSTIRAAAGGRCFCK